MATLCILGHPAAGHIQPTLPVIAELVRRGDRVEYWATEPFRARVEDTGATFASYGAHELFERNLGTGGLPGGMAGLLETAEEILPALLESLRRSQPDLLLVETHAVWGNLAAQVTGIPAVALSSMFAVAPSMLSTRELLVHLSTDAPREAALDALLAMTRAFDVARRIDGTYGTSTPGLIGFLGNPQPLNLVLTARELQPRAELLDATYVFTGMRGGGRTKRSGRPLIYVSLGTMYNDEPDFYRAAMIAFGDEYRVVIAAGTRLDLSLLPQPRPHVTVRRTVPQLEILGEADLFITHGGINSAHEAMLCGVPMIVVPRAADHHIVARQIEAAGAGVILPRDTATPALLRELAARVLGDTRYAERSARAGDALRAAGGPELAADCIHEVMAIEAGS